MATQQPISLTEAERRKIEAELNELVSVKRPEIAFKIGRAAADGDLSENGAYHYAKEQQGHLEGRIHELEYILRNSVVVTPELGLVGLGSIVTVEDGNGKQRTYNLVSKHGASPSQGAISDESPLGGALMGHKPGDTVTFEAPNGTRTVKILSIE